MVGVVTTRSHAPPAPRSQEHCEDPTSPCSPETDSWGRGGKRGDSGPTIRLRVDYKRLNTFLADYTKNISKGGTFIRTVKPLDVGTEFVFVLSVPSHNKQFELKGEVVWVVTKEKADVENPAGMGIRFKLTDDSDFIEKLLDEALGQHTSTKLLSVRCADPAFAG